MAYIVLAMFVSETFQKILILAGGLYLAKMTINWLLEGVWKWKDKKSLQ